MANRRKMRAAKAEEERQKRRVETKKKNKKRAIYALVVVIMVALGIFLATSPPNPMQCFPYEAQNKLTFDTKLFIWVGEPKPGPGARFIYINYGIGKNSDCRWPITTGPESPTCTSRDDWAAERCADWVMVHIASPIVHDYTLGEFFRIWGGSPGSNRTGQSPTCNYFSSDGVCATRGPTSVSYNFGPWIAADPNMAFHPQDRIDIKVLA